MRVVSRAAARPARLACAVGLFGGWVVAADPPGPFPSPTAGGPRLTAYSPSSPLRPAAFQAPSPTVAPPVTPAAPLPAGPALGRLPALGGTPPAPTVAPEVQARFDRHVGRIVDAENILDVSVGRSRLLLLKSKPSRVQLADETAARLTTVTERELSVAGLKVGTTTLTLWFPDPATPDQPEVLTYLVRVLPDPDSRRRLDQVYEALAGEVNRAFPDSAIKLQFVGDRLVLSGHAKDVHDAYQILRVVQANAPNDPATGSPAATAGLPTGGLVQAGAVTGPDLSAAAPNVVNLLRVGGEHQVMLKVTVAEVNRAAARSVGVNFDIARKDGLVVFANLTGGLISGGGNNGGGLLTGGGVGAVGQNGSVANLSATLGGGQVAAAVNALRTLNLARSLAEPNLVALNGRPASFQAGGQFPVPVVTGFTSAGLQGVQFVPYGVGLQFTPVITDDDRVRLTVAADVSTRDAASGTTSIGGAAVPSLATRNFQTTVELRSGETMAVAGLIQTNFGSDATRVPWAGDLPVVGRLFAFDRTANAEQELVVLITPTLVRPLAKGDPQPIPGCDLIPPSDLEFYLLGRLQAHCPGTDTTLYDPAAARKVRKLEKQLLTGPVGPTDR